MDSNSEWQEDGAILLGKLANRLRQKHLALIAALGQAGKLHQAAAQINVTQPSATKMLADIEDTLGFAVFERLPRGMRATSLGAEVVQFAQQSQARLAHFVAELESKRRGGYGQLVLGAIMGAAPDLLARAVTELKADRPMLDIRILGETSDQLGTLLTRHEIEFAVGRFSGPLQHNFFDFEPLSNETLRVVVRSAHPIARKRSVDLALLAALPWVLQPVTSPARQVVEQEFERASIRSPRNVVECASVFATLQLLQFSDLVAVLPEAVVRDYVRARVLRVLPMEFGLSLTGFGLLTRKGETLSEPAAMLAHLLRRNAALRPK